MRRFNEALNENPGEHFTPREVIRLMVLLLLALDDEILSQSHIVRTVCDPCCGTGGMLTIAKERIAEINPKAEVHLFGQEVNPETFAVCKADLYMKSADGRDAENIKFGSTLSSDAPCRPPLRLPVRQSALRQGMEDGPGRCRAGGRARRMRVGSALGCRASATANCSSSSTCSPA